ncbi:MAG: helix-turn-helix transcriptional regulator [Clostridiales bacterium]|nr:helix-turn-helix transcriptional regulator [Clostridiales bacterium]
MEQKTLRTKRDTEYKTEKSGNRHDAGCPAFLPLINSAFSPGRCLETIRAVEDPVQRDIAFAEYHYFTGHPKEAIRVVEPYMKSSDPYLCLPACFMYAYASFSTDGMQDAYDTLISLRGSFKEISEQEDTPHSLRSLTAFISGAAQILLYLPSEDDSAFKMTNLQALPPGLRSFACYVWAHRICSEGDFAKSLGIVETALAFQSEVYNIATIYLHVVAVMDYIGLKEPEKAKEQMQIAWELARPDGLFEVFGEHHAYLGGLVEAMFKKDYPEEFKRIIEITCNFANGWRKMHRKFTGDHLVDNLTTTEFAVGMLAAQGWSNREISEQMDISINTVKFHMMEILNKLEISKRSELKEYLLR